eukprot:CAMPEP_0117687198 /NCGR_PEP_ID=MMETSP0804-20121206/22984_1 /TAXON_ID=1074897 /ORGANISM="Tetraselmis astigmatica, Strain CCMP880" /LENGTH=873 /DNA_ID=CAMNT_0005499199 /DNA_START=292 /DNA_END=2913 /DNA_ORIENTATION=-
MARIGVNIPPGMTITTGVCQAFYREGKKLPSNVWNEVLANIEEVEEAYGAKFGDAANPLLFSVRSGAALSMPGMMNTVLNLGINDEIVEGLAAKWGERFAWDAYRRFLDMYGDVVLEISHDEFEAEMSAIKKERGAKLDTDLVANDLKRLVSKYKEVFSRNGFVVPTDPWEQLHKSISAVFMSWMVPRAVKYREIHKIRGLAGTAVNVQSMVYGNLSDRSGTGVCFTRSPTDGTHKLYGEFLVNAQGEDVVAGIRTPLPISEMAKAFPEAYVDLIENTNMLERHMKDMQDCEFTVQEGKLFMLQTRNGKRTGKAALKVAVDLQRERLITVAQAVMMVDPHHLDQLLHPQFSDTKAYLPDVIAKGLNASPGAAVGRIVFSAADAELWGGKGEAVILTRSETTPEDVGGMWAAQGILTSRGGMTSHAAVVARGWGKPCVCGCEAAVVDQSAKTLTIGDKVFQEGDWLSLNGNTGEVILGKKELVVPTAAGGEVGKFMEWVDLFRSMEVYANADTPEDCLVARNNGATGVGLVRTEHMFFSTKKRIAAVRRMIAAQELGAPGKAQALEEIKAFQREDFEGIFKAMDNLPVTIRLLDPPLHEFLPQEGPALEAICKQLAEELGVGSEDVARRMHGLAEVNPMLGLRGCRLGVVHSDITEMQATAIFEAAVDAARSGYVPRPHIMVPLVGSLSELQHQKQVILKAAKDVFDRFGVTIHYEVGTMIEVPRAALQADKLAQEAEFFSFGTNDLTQMTFGFSRDDAEAKFLPQYVKAGLLPCDPFEEFDGEGVGQLVKLAVKLGRETRPSIGLGICGEHGGDPNSIAFFNKVGLDYVSCSPLRVPIARLAAAQAALTQGTAKCWCGCEALMKASAFAHTSD